MVLAIAPLSCAVGPNFARPNPPASQRYTFEEQPSRTVAAEGAVQHFTPGAKITVDWWHLFDCPALNTVLTQAFARNPTLQAAQAALRQSQDNLRAGYGIFYPQIGASFQPSRQQFSPARFGENTSPSIFNLYTLSATVGYVLDIWGGERRTVEGLGAQAEAQYYNEEGSYLTLAGNVINTIVAEAAYAGEIEATEQLISFLEQQEGITAAQIRGGTVAYANLLSIQSQLATAEASLPPLQQQLAHSRHLLATLMGQEPADAPTLEVSFSELTLPRDLPVSLPSTLVRERPDVMVAEAQLHYASAQIGVATAAMLPSFTLNATYGYNTTSLYNLFGSNAEFWTLGAGIASPLIQGPTLWYQRKAAIDAYQQALGIYRQTVLAALAQVADVLDALQHDAQTLKAQSEALGASAEALRLIDANYKAGTVNYLDVLIADYQYQEAHLGYIQALGQRFQDTTALFVALGGGWQPAPSTKRTSCCDATPVTP